MRFSALQEIKWNVFHRAAFGVRCHDGTTYFGTTYFGTTYFGFTYFGTTYFGTTYFVQGGA
jgi:hypothetical protein